MQLSTVFSRQQSYIMRLTNTANVNCVINYWNFNRVIKKYFLNNYCWYYLKTAEEKKTSYVIHNLKTRLFSRSIFIHQLSQNLNILWREFYTVVHYLTINVLEHLYETVYCFGQLKRKTMEFMRVDNNQTFSNIHTKERKRTDCTVDEVSKLSSANGPIDKNGPFCIIWMMRLAVFWLRFGNKYHSMLKQSEKFWFVPREIALGCVKFIFFWNFSSQWNIFVHCTFVSFEQI